MLYIYTYKQIDSTFVCKKNTCAGPFQYYKKIWVTILTQRTVGGPLAPDVFVLSVVQCIINALELSGPGTIYWRQVG